ncbi:MAG: hypothetical protein P8185_03820 [Deltaproteobacteria bacterium]|jgi:hypothetical protein
MKGKANRAVAPLSEGGSGYGATWRAIARKSDGGFRFDTPQLAAGSFIFLEVTNRDLKFAYQYPLRRWQILRTQTVDTAL